MQKVRRVPDSTAVQEGIAMGYNVENYRKVKETIDGRRAAALQEADLRTALLHTLSPELAEIDRKLSGTGMRLFRVATEGGTNLQEKLAAARAEHEALKERRAALLLSLGYPADYTAPHYTCEKCHDTGFIEARMCSCMREALVLEGVRSSGLGALINRQSFENFSLDYYRDTKENAERAAYTLSRARAYAENFSTESGNLLLMGPTGLGKTHLSTAIARTVIERGYDVVYESVQNLLADFEYDRFKSGYGESTPRGNRYLLCELLIVDDLGTEQTNQFVTATLYHLINTRLNHARPTVISTNLIGDEELRTRYGDRISSRLLGEFELLLLLGTDIRMQKL